MKVVFHEKFRTVYSCDPAAADGRLDAAIRELGRYYEFVEPESATEDLLRLNHTDDLINEVRRDRTLYAVACLAVGGAVRSAELALSGEPAFGLIRPPGHHASPGSYWGFCYFNNIAVAIKKLLKEKSVDGALIVDIDLHFGDGTASSFSQIKNVTYSHPNSSDPADFVRAIKELGEGKRTYGLLGVSAGFDRALHDWGGMLGDEDYRAVGAALKHLSEAVCRGKRFAVLEGGYNHQTLGKTIRSFLGGFD